MADAKEYSYITFLNFSSFVPFKLIGVAVNSSPKRGFYSFITILALSAL